MWKQKLRITEQVERGESRPRLTVIGLWLTDAGFPVDALVEVEVVEPGRLMVTRLDEEGVEVDGLSPLVWIPAEQLGAIEESVRRSSESSEPAELAEEAEAAHA